MTYQITSKNLRARSDPDIRVLLARSGRVARNLTADYGLLVGFFAGWQIPSTATLPRPSP
ncbi:hypothetical protein KNW02_10220 [Paracoccus sp. XHP0099]|uniref:Uncharacterized protein n=1 Tax=Paracoccus marinaquae TaxID=2841926 RepID=A0ABS6AJT9_9RHOB|nr:hypothetical protein [Paracoccus marinaquae]